MNAVILSGRLSSDPVLRCTPNAKAVADHLAKGRRVLVDGYLSQRRWETPDGEKRSRVQVVARQVELLDPPRSAETTAAA